MATTLRDYQETAYQQVRQAVGEGVRRLVVQMPTGAGKTRLAAEIVNGASGKKKRVIFEVPAIALVDQTVEAFYAEGIDKVGVIQANHHMTDWSRPIQVCSVQTLMRRGVPDADVVLRDECHKLFKFDMRWMLEDQWRRVPFIGLSATPWTRGLGKLYERLVVGNTTQQMIDNGWLVPMKVYAPSHPDLKDVRIVAGEYHQDDLAKAINKEKLTADIVDTWLRLADGRPTICFAVDRNHADSLAKRFEQAGVPSAYVDCMTPGDERSAVKRRFERGDVKVVCNVDIVGIGVDWPFVSCISYCRPTRSEIRFVQNIGRGLRLSPGKTDLLVLDHSDTHLRLGFVTDIQHDGLSMGREATTAPPSPRLPKDCPKCGYLKQYGVRTCPNCGHTTAPPPPVREYNGADLEEFKGKKSRGKAEKMTTAEKAIFLAELKGYAEQHSYKPGWAAYKFKSRFDVWPCWQIKDVAPIAAASAATLTWIKGQQIRWAKSKANGNGHAVSAAAPARAPAPTKVPHTLCTTEDLDDFR